MKNYSRPRRDSNSQSSDSKSDALSIRPRGLDLLCTSFHETGWRLPYMKTTRSPAQEFAPQTADTTVFKKSSVLYFLIGLHMS